MAVSDYAIAFTLKNEGGFVERVGDPGGATNFGISLRFLNHLTPEELANVGMPKVVHPEDVERMTVDQAKQIYQVMFWEAGGFDRMSSVNLARHVFDFAVTSGIGTAIKSLQQAIWAVRPDRFHTLKNDGVLGPATLGMINESDIMLENEFIAAFISERANFYRNLVEKDTSLKIFLEGWLNRAYQP